jgi:predicted CoA-binding protein
MSQSNPPSIAVVGASADHRKFGNKCVRAYLQAGYQVFPVNPRGHEIEGLETYGSVRDLPTDPDRISIYLPPVKTRALIPELASRTGSEIWFNPGSADAQTLQQARDLGLDVRDGCSIVDIGLSPSQF